MFLAIISTDQNDSRQCAFGLSRGNTGAWGVWAGLTGHGQANVSGSGELHIRKRWIAAPGEEGRLRIAVDGRREGDAYVVEVERVLDGACRVFVAEIPGGVAVASHVRLLKDAGVDTAIDDALLPEVMLYRFVAAPRTMFKNVRQLRAGEKLKLTMRGGRVERETVGLFRPATANGETPADVVQELSDSLLDAHRDYKLDHLDFTTLLSGGLDSSILAVVGSKLFGNKRTYSCAYGFADRERDVEYQYASSAAGWIGVEHKIHIPTPASYLHSLVDSAIAAEQSALHLQTGLIHSVVQACVVPSGAKVWSCGEGADGLFGQKIQRVLLDLRGRPIARRALGMWPTRLALRAVSTATNRFGMLADLPGRDLNGRVPLTDPSHILWSCAVFGERGWIRSNMGRETFAARAECLSPYEGVDTLDQLMLLSLLGEVTETEAVWCSVSESLGASAIFPYTHPSFVACASRIPWPSRLERPKGHLRDAAAVLGVPDPILRRPKASFDVRPEVYGPEGSVLEPLVRVAAGGFPAALMKTLRSPNVFKSQMFFTALNIGLIRRHFELGHSRETLHDELDRAMKDLGVWERMNQPTG